jgi:hypothetical protein
MSYKTVYRVIIFVREATSRLSFSNFPNQTFLEWRFSTTHDAAEIIGAGLSSKIFARMSWFPSKSGIISLFNYLGVS